MVHMEKEAYGPSQYQACVALALALLVGRTFVPQEDVVVADNSTLGAVDAQQQQLVQMVQLPDAAQGKQLVRELTTLPDTRRTHSKIALAELQRLSLSELSALTPPRSDRASLMTCDAMTALALAGFVAVGLLAMRFDLATEVAKARKAATTQM
mmetsp:Transcript_31187/g.71191  ORF Transcript_31187/g.71191 Transcript_31187/m.71191 type:complete len:154 (-) Transcript_31187:191-652(-)